MGPALINRIILRVCSASLLIGSFTVCQGQARSPNCFVSLGAAGLLNVPLGARYIGFPDTTIVPSRDVDLSYYRSRTQAGCSWAVHASVARRLVGPWGLAVGLCFVDRPSRYAVDDDTLAQHRGTGSVLYSELTDHRYRLEGLLKAERISKRWSASLGIGYTLYEVFSSHRINAETGEESVLRYVNRTGVRGIVPFMNIGVVPFERWKRWSTDALVAYRPTRKFGQPGLDISIGLSYRVGRNL